MVTVAELLDGHVTLTVDSLDRLYLNGYAPKLQTGGQLVRFLEQRRGGQVCSPALLEEAGARFRAAVEQFAAARGLTIATFGKRDRKDDVAAKVRAAFRQAEGVYLLATAQEKCHGFKGRKLRSDSGRISFEFSPQQLYVTHYYFYLLDEDFGPAFIKVGTYAPYPVRVCLNGHEWLKCQLAKAGIAFKPLDNGILSCADPEALQRLAGQLGPDQIQAFFGKWLDRLPMPLGPEDREAGYGWRLSVWQAEVSLTQVFARPLRGRQFFDEVIRENLDLGRPERVQLLFDRRITASTPGRFFTRVVHAGVHPRLQVRYKSCDIRQYFKLNQALRNECVMNNPLDFGIGKDISNLWKLRRLGSDINRRLLQVERVSQHCALDLETVDSIIHPTVTQDGQRAPGLRFGEPRTMALMAAALVFSHLPEGFTNAALRRQVADLLGPDASYGARQMTYDLRRMRRKGLIARQGKSHRYRLTTLGLRACAFFTKLDARVFRPASAAMHPQDPVPRPLRMAFRRLDEAVAELVQNAHFKAAS
jgi:hypothetical protein